jgi:hypothetical protein
MTAVNSTPSCEVCGKTFTAPSRGRPKTLCSKPCWYAKRKALKPKLPDLSCGTCKTIFSPTVKWQTYCSMDCKERASRDRNGWLPRGLHNRSCAVCGSSFQSQDKNSIYCSKACNLRAYKARKGIQSLSKAAYLKSCLDKKIERLAVVAARRAERLEARRQSKLQPKPMRLPRYRPCRGCGATLVCGSGKRICEDCKVANAATLKRMHKQIRRARLRAATIERFSDVEIFERDNWICQICMRQTPRQLVGSNDPLAPTIDHVIALVNGGAHSRANVQCACRRCNSIKSDKPMESVRISGGE